jgi:HD domain
VTYAGIKVVDSQLVRDAIDLAKSTSEPYLYNHVMRSWLFAVLLSEGMQTAPDAELLAVSSVLHDLGLTEQYEAEARFEVDGANAARSFLEERGIAQPQVQLVWDAIALHSTPSLALHKEPEVSLTHQGVTVDVIGLGLERIAPSQVEAILAEFPRLHWKQQIKECLCRIIRKKPQTTYDNFLHDIGNRYVEGYTAPQVADLFANAPYAE